MISYNKKTIYFSGRGNKIEKDELEKYLIQHGATLTPDLANATLIIEGKFTDPHLENTFYEYSKNGVELLSIETIEKEFSLNLDIDSLLVALKISKDNDRLIKLLNNKYFSNEVFIQLLKYYNWKSDDIYDNDDNRDVCTIIVERFCELSKTNHNIQYSPIGVYYTALETHEPKLLEVLYSMPNYTISNKNTTPNQPLTIKEVVALNPNILKPLQLQILKNSQTNELRFLAQNQSINTSVQKQLISLDIEVITLALIQSGNFNNSMIETLIKNDKSKRELLKSVPLTQILFDEFLMTSTDVEMINLALNNSLCHTMIHTLFEKDIPNVNINLLKHPNCPTAQIDKFIKMADKVYSIAIAHNSSLNDAQFDALYHQVDLDVNVSLAYNVRTPIVVLKSLATLNNNFINEGLCANTSTPINILMQFQFDGGLKPILSNNDTFREFTRNIIGM